MSDKLAQLAARKELLKARSSLLRLRMQAEWLDVHERLSWSRIGISAAKSAPVRSALFGLALSRLGHSRVARLLSLASKAILIAKMTGVAVDIKRKLNAEKPDSSDSAANY